MLKFVSPALQALATRQAPLVSLSTRAFACDASTAGPETIQAMKDKLQKERAKRDSIQRNRLQRMSEEIGEYVEPQKKWYLIYPNNPLKLAFDLLIAIMLIYSCCAVPIQLAFFSDSINSEHNQFWFISFLVVDIFFYIDHDRGRFL